MSDFWQDANDSVRIAHVAAPILKDLFMKIPGLFETNDLSIFPVEDVDIKILQHLDRNCGIDYFVASKSDNRTIGLAWRAIRYDRSKYHGRVWNAFSVREKRSTSPDEKNCELYKRKSAIKLGLIYPQYTAQAHFDPSNNDTLLSLAIARTSDVYEAFDKGLYRVCDPNNKDKEVFFYDVQWRKMKENGYKIYDWYKDDSCK